MLKRGCSSPGRALGSQSSGSRFKSGQLQEEVEWMNLKIAAGKNENIKEIYSFIYYNCFILR